MTVATYTNNTINNIANEAFFNAGEHHIGWSTANIGGHVIMVTVSGRTGYTEYSIIQNGRVIIWSTKQETIINSMVAVV